MKRTLQFVCLLTVFVMTGCNAASKGAPQEAEPTLAGSNRVSKTVANSDISGTWVLLSIFENSQEKPSRDRVKTRVVFQNGRYEAWGMQRAPSIGEYSVSPGLNYPKLDLTVRGHTLKGVYTVEGDVLRIYSFKTNSLSRPAETNRVPDIVIQTYRKNERESNKTN